MCVCVWYHFYVHTRCAHLCELFHLHVHTRCAHVCELFHLHVHTRCVVCYCTHSLRSCVCMYACRMEDRKRHLVQSVGFAGVGILSVLILVGRKSYHKKVAQLTKKTGDVPGRVWSVLTPAETIKVFAVPFVYVSVGCALLGTGLKQWMGIKDWKHGVETLRWITHTGPAPTQHTNL